MVQNKLTLVKPTNLRTSNGGIVWKCKCSCGNTCCSICNTAKMSRSYTEFISWLDNLILFRTRCAEVHYKNTPSS